jgi:hypothetical protein
MPEILPSDLWGRSAYRMLGNRAPWTKKIRPDALAKAKNRCELCGAKEERLICHDKWTYDDTNAIATLSGFEIHCGNCDLVTHLGRMVQVSNDPESIVLAAVIHLNNVNGCKTLASTSIIKEAYSLWEKRNKKKWKVCVAPELVSSYPELEVLPKFIPDAPYPPPTQMTGEADILKFVSSGNPTETMNAAWIVATNKGRTKKATGRTGKRLLFVAEKSVDNTWQNLKKAVEAGKLWKEAKVSTALFTRDRSYVICVYTYDHDDAKDVARIREYLREMGFKRPITYKTDDQTSSGVYSDATGGIAKYRS